MRRHVFADRPYTVSLHDNDLAHDDTTPLGVVTTAAEALDLALDAVDRQLLVRPLHRATADALYAPFADWGQSPCIDHGPSPLPFDADTYARRLCAAVAGLGPDEAPDAARALRDAYRAECLSPPCLDALCQSDLPATLRPGARWPVLLALHFTADTVPYFLPRSARPPGGTVVQRLDDTWLLACPLPDDEAPRDRGWLQASRRRAGAARARVVMHAAWDRIAVHLGTHLPSVRAMPLHRVAWLLREPDDGSTAAASGSRQPA